MFCENCGKKISNSAKHCPNCGKKVPKISLASPVSAEPKSFSVGNFFSGRISRRNYWVFWGLSLLVSILAAAFFSTENGDPNTVGMILLLLMFFVGVTVYLRRIHDLNLSFWYGLLFFIPIANLGFVIYVAFASPVEGDNKYGEYKNRDIDFARIFGFKTTQL